MCIQERDPCIESASAVLSDRAVLRACLEELEGGEALHVHLGVGDVVLGGVELGDHDVGAVESVPQLLLFRLRGLAVSAPGGVEEDEHVLALDAGFEVLTHQHSHVVLFGVRGDRLGLQLGLEGASSVCGQESSHRGRAERLRAEVAGALLDVVFN